jgi:hypothetical protein
MRLFLWICLVAASVRAQAVSAGFKVGSAVNTPNGLKWFGNTNTDLSRWTGGPSVEVKLLWRFAVEFNALYSADSARSDYPIRFSTATNSYQFSNRLQREHWDFPLLLKYRFQIGPAHPFLSAGSSFRRTRSENSAQYQCLGPAGSCASTEFPQSALLGGSFRGTNWRTEPVVGAGLEFRTRYVTITPEVRMQRSRDFGGVDNRFVGLVGFSFGKR